MIGDNARTLSNEFVKMREEIDLIKKIVLHIMEGVALQSETNMSILEASSETLAKLKDWERSGTPPERSQGGY